MSAGVALARALARPRGAARLVPARVRGALLRATIERLLRDRGLEEVLELLGATSTATPTTTRTTTPTTTATSTATSTSTATTTPTAIASTSARDTLQTLRQLPATCLHRALAGYAALREAGEEPRFVIGVRRDGGDIVAHAWIEQAGRPVGEPDDPRARFTVAYVHPAPGPPPTPMDEDEMPAPRPSPDVILTRLADGTGVLLHLGTKFYFALNATGVAVWEALASGAPVDADRLADLLVERFAGVDRARARADVEALLRDLAAEGLLAKGP